MKFYWDENGHFRVKPDQKCLWPLARFLEGDIQGDSVCCRRILDEIANIKAGKIDCWEMIGNAFTLTITRDKACLENHYEEDMHLELALDDFTEAVSNWFSLLRSKPR